MLAFRLVVFTFPTSFCLGWGNLGFWQVRDLVGKGPILSAFVSLDSIVETI